jgi:hypothetical protein
MRLYEGKGQTAHPSGMETMARSTNPTEIVQIPSPNTEFDVADTPCRSTHVSPMLGYTSTAQADPQTDSRLWSSVWTDSTMAEMFDVVRLNKNRPKTSLYARFGSRTRT